MKLKNAEIYNVKEPLAKLLTNVFPVKTSLALVRLAKKFDEQFAIIDEVRNGLIMKYGEAIPEKQGQFSVAIMVQRTDIDGNLGINDDGTPAMMLNPQYEKLNAELAELMDMETEIVFVPVTLPDTLEIDPATLMALEKFVKV